MLDEDIRARLVRVCEREVRPKIALHLLPLVFVVGATTAAHMFQKPKTKNQNPISPRCKVHYLFSAAEATFVCFCATNFRLSCLISMKVSSREQEGRPAQPPTSSRRPSRFFTPTGMRTRAGTGLATVTAVAVLSSTCTTTQVADAFMSTPTSSSSVPRKRSSPERPFTAAAAVAVVTPEKKVARTSSLLPKKEKTAPTQAKEKTKTRAKNNVTKSFQAVTAATRPHLSEEDRSTPLHTLILGTHPSIASLGKSQYYAHPLKYVHSIIIALLNCDGMDWKDSSLFFLSCLEKSALSGGS